MSRLTETRINRRTAPARRGNSIVLVSALLVLLVIIAAAYVTRTNAGRGTASAIRTAELRDSKAEVVRDMVAQHIADALFVAPLQPLDRGAQLPNPTRPADANEPRLPITSYDQKFGTITPTGRYNVDLDYPYNHAPQHVVPFTNWPDNATLSLNLGGAYIPSSWPAGPGHPSGGAGGGLAHEGNPVGNPGSGDTRWLRDFEPMRIDTDGDGVLDAFSHFRHLTNLSTPNNGFRVCQDISDITDFNGDGVGGVVEDLNIPVEQWLATPRPITPSFMPNTISPVSGNTRFTSTGAEFDAWLEWSGSLEGYQFRYTGFDPARQPPSNFYRLRDLNADRTIHNYFDQDIPQAEFVPGTARNLVSRYLADTDGDGYTDALWHLLPLPVQDGIRYIGAFSIIDNSAMINPNVATRFQFRDDFNYLEGGNPGFNSRTKGYNAADIALTSQLALGTTFNNWNVGFYDNPLHDNFTTIDGQNSRFDYYPPYWQYHLDRTGLPAGALTQEQRLDYYRRAGLNPLTASSVSFYQPFSLADELEIRQFYGQDNDWIISRYEFSVQHPYDRQPVNPSDPNKRFLRAAQEGIVETAEISAQLSNRMLVLDPRHRITMYSNNRNELLAPWLRYRWLEFDEAADQPENDPDDFGLLDATLPEPVRNDKDSGAYAFLDLLNNFNQQQQQKLDLREPVFVHDGGGSYVEYNPGWDDDAGVANGGPGLMSFSERLPIALMHALDDGPRLDNSGTNYIGRTYFGEYSFPAVQGGPGGAPDEFDPDDTGNVFERTRAMAASFAANILAYRDADTEVLLNDPQPTDSIVQGAIGPPDHPAMPAPDETKFLGMELQPFLLEVFVGHVYRAVEVPPQSTANGTQFTNAGNYVVLHADERYTPIIVVQIANPYDRPILLFDGQENLFGRRVQYELHVFNKVFQFDPSSLVPSAGPTSQIWLPPGTPERPATAILFAMGDADLQTRTQWRDFLDITSDDHPDNTLFFDVSNDWPDNRDDFESLAAEDEAIALYRRIEDPPGNATYEEILIDRIDQPTGSSSDSFKEAVEELDRPPDMEAPSDMPEEYAGGIPPADTYQAPEWDMGPDHTHWVQWVRATRAWGVDFDGDGFYQQDERNPRYVFTHKAVVEAERSEFNTFEAAFPVDDSYWDAHGGNRYTPDPGVDPDQANGRGIPWFWRDYETPYEATYSTGMPTTKRTGKPTFFTMRNTVRSDLFPTAPLLPDVFGVGHLPDKGWYGQTATTGGGVEGVDEPFLPTSGTDPPRVIHDFSMQMLQKDGDFEQVGELLNVWLWGHQLSVSPSGTGFTYEETVRTFSEFMAEELEDLPIGDRLARSQVNRLSFGEEALGQPPESNDPMFYRSAQHAAPNLPAGLRVLDLFVCDSYGANVLDYNNDGNVDDADLAYADQFRRFNNAAGFTGRPVYGQINVNNAPVEVNRSTPHTSRVVHENLADRPPRSYLPEAMTQYRERFSGSLGLSYGLKNLIDLNDDGGYEDLQPGPDYSDRDALISGIDDVRSERGFASTAEILMLNQQGSAANAVDANRWRAGFAGMNPFTRQTSPQHDLDRTTSRLSTDVIDDFRYDYLGLNEDQYWDMTAGDSEELNMLYAGLSNMVTTRSDTFTVYFRLRAFKQNPVTGRWDATDPEYIVDDSRYVMLVDRSNVNRPGDKPRILYFEKLPK